MFHELFQNNLDFRKKQIDILIYLNVVDHANFRKKTSEAVEAFADL